MSARQRHEVDPTTRMNDESRIRRSIVPNLGDVPLVLFVRDAPERLEKLYARLRKCRARRGEVVALQGRTVRDALTSAFPSPRRQLRNYAGLRPHAVIIGASMRSRSPRVRLMRCVSISAGVASSAASSWSRTCWIVAASRIAQAREAMGK